MHTIEIASWDDFLATISKLKERFGAHGVEGFRQRNLILYRGQADAGWHLETTLERYSPSPCSIECYARLALRCAPQIESFTDRRWDLPDYRTGTAVLHG